MCTPAATYVLCRVGEVSNAVKINGAPGFTRCNDQYL